MLLAYARVLQLYEKLCSTLAVVEADRNLVDVQKLDLENILLFVFSLELLHQPCQVYICEAKYATIFLESLKIAQFFSLKFIFINL